MEPRTGLVKVCDLGDAKVLQVSTVYSKAGMLYYKAPELLPGPSLMNYTCKVDVWSAGCVLAEMIVRRLIFIANSADRQLQKIYQVVGTPTRKDFEDMVPGMTKPLLPEDTSASNLVTK